MFNCGTSIHKKYIKTYIVYNFDKICYSIDKSID